MGVSVKRIVVTGMGIVSPLGCGVQHVWQSLLAGKSGITRLSEQLVADIPCKVAGQVPSIDSDPLHGFDHGDRHRDRRVQRDRQCGTYHR